ncbi:DUF1162 domain-containing protein/Apt1 domain-containing protein [Cucumis melo var. makuwa]|uniref:DUF1162 domain-containing protein/Apt1 domain-containing protein n=1 Tax=Cucumis melo var. makuwa TaxID=1194695 RepID=A0A5D3CP37_CUCMM|nr:DUF1162 domain-containing protein/Apt1 domain-containing protein [Cucumis melo var. makuwa]
MLVKSLHRWFEVAESESCISSQLDYVSQSSFSYPKCYFCQVIGNLSPAISYLGSCSWYPQEFMKQNIMLTKPMSKFEYVKGASISCHTSSMVHGAFKIKRIDAILHNSRRGDTFKSTKIFSNSQKMAEINSPDCGIWMSVDQGRVKISLSDFMLKLSLSSRSGSSSEGLTNIHHSSISRSNGLNVENSDMAVDSEGPGGRILITRCSMYDILTEAHQLSKLSSDLSVGEDFRWKIQGGVIFLETLALTFFVNCFHKYCHAIGSLLSVLQFSDQQDKKGQEMAEITRLEESATDNIVGKTTDDLLRVKGKLLEVFILNVSNISLVLVVKDGSDVIREFVIEADANLKFQLADNKKELRISLSHLSILSQQIRGTLQNNIQIPHFSSNLFSHPAAGELAASSQHAKRVHIDNDASSSKHPVSHKNFSGSSHFTGPFCFSCRHYLLENLVASLSIEKTCRDGIGILSKAWAGKGSLSGLDLILSHSEIQAIFLLVSSFSGLYDKEKTNKHKMQWSGGQQVDANNTETFTTLVPDGAIVAIQDIHQHMYFCVEGYDRYNLVGVMHYSLKGDRALFRVIL